MNELDNPSSHANNEFDNQAHKSRKKEKRICYTRTE